MSHAPIGTSQARVSVARAHIASSSDRRDSEILGVDGGLSAPFEPLAGALQEDAMPAALTRRSWFVDAAVGALRHRVSATAAGSPVLREFVAYRRVFIEQRGSSRASLTSLS